MIDNRPFDLGESFDDLLAELPTVGVLPPTTVARVRRRRGVRVAGVAGGVVLAAAGAFTLAPGAGPDRLLPTPANTGSPATTPAASKAPDQTRPAAPIVVLQSDGLGFVTGAASIRQMPFISTDAATIRRAVTRALGPGTATPVPDCGPGRVSLQFGPLSLLVAGNRFVGWSDRHTTGRTLKTADGIGAGSTLADLRASFATVRLSRGSIGEEWTTQGGLGGTLDGSTGSSRVTFVAAGERCTYR